MRALCAEELGILYNTREGGLREGFHKIGKNTIVQVASGRFGVHPQYLNRSSVVEIKMGQGLPGAKNFRRYFPHKDDS